MPEQAWGDGIRWIAGGEGCSEGAIDQFLRFHTTPLLSLTRVHTSFGLRCLKLEAREVLEVVHGCSQHAITVCLGQRHVYLAQNRGGGIQRAATAAEGACGRSMASRGAVMGKSRSAESSARDSSRRQGELRRKSREERGGELSRLGGAQAPKKVVIRSTVAQDTAECCGRFTPPLWWLFQVPPGPQRVPMRRRRRWAPCSLPRRRR